MTSTLLRVWVFVKMTSVVGEPKTSFATARQPAVSFSERNAVVPANTHTVPATIGDPSPAVPNRAGMVSLPAGHTKPGLADAAGACSSVAPRAPAVIRELRPSLTVLFIGNSSCEVGG